MISGRKYKECLPWIYVVSMALLLIGRDLMGVPFNKFIYVIVAAVCMFSAEYNDVVCMVFFTMPLLYGLPGIYLLLTICAALFYKKQCVRGRLVLLTLFFAFLEVTASIWYPESDWMNILKYMLTLLLFFYLLMDQSELDLKKCIFLFMLGSALLFLVIIISGIQKSPSNWLEAYARGALRFGDIQVDENSGITLKVNANTLAYHSVVCIAFGLLALREGLLPYRWIAVAIIAVSIVAGILSTSRSWALVLLLCLVLFSLSQMKSVKSILIFLISAVCVGMIVSKILSSIPHLLDGFFVRFSHADLASGNGRSELFVAYMQVFINNLRFFFLGMGVSQYRAVSGVWNSMHNGLQQIFVCYGIFGGYVFLAELVRPCINLRKSHVELLYWLPLIAVVTFTQTIQFINPHNLMLPYVVSVYALRIGARKNEGVSYNS